MKTILATLNAKYIHTSPALQWLYIANKERFDISYREFVMKEDVYRIADDLLSQHPDVIGIGIYIWNVEKSRTLASILKNCKPEIILIAGGPEVGHEPEYFLGDGTIDFIISGEGEFVLGELLSVIENNQSGDHASISIESVSHRHRIDKTPAKANLSKLAGLPSPYRLMADQEDLKNRIVYFETSRGCPYQCTYCLSSAEKGVRYFPLEYVFQNLAYLIENGVRQVKFLDRTFNLNQERSLAIFDFLISRYKPGLSFQFEIIAELLTDEIIHHLNNTLQPHYFRFEAGIQSTFEPTIRAIRRRQDFETLAAKIQKLTDGQKVDMHLDLIAGLPYEPFDRFSKSFNDVFALRAKEVQLGFLKMLRGTSIRRNADLFGYQFNQQAPYDIIRSKWLNIGELKRLHAAEHALEIYWNSGKFKRAMQALFGNAYKNRYFEFFDEIGQYREAHPFRNNYQLEDMFLHLYQFLLSKGIDLFRELREDYYSCFKIRPRGFLENRMEKKIYKLLRYQIGNDKAFLETHQLTRQIIEKQTVIDIFDESRLLLTVFCTDGSRVNPLFLHYPNILPNK